MTLFGGLSVADLLQTRSPRLQRRFARLRLPTTMQSVVPTARSRRSGASDQPSPFSMSTAMGRVESAQQELEADDRRNGARGCVVILFRGES